MLEIGPNLQVVLMTIVVITGVVLLINAWFRD